MLRILLLLIGGLLFIASIAASALWLDQIIYLWTIAINFLLNFFKGLTVKKMWLLLLPFAKRIIFIEIPKKFILFLGFMGVPREVRLKALAYSNHMRHKAQEIKDRCMSKVQKKFRKLTTFALSLIISGVIFLIFAMAGIGYVVVWLWGVPVFISQIAFFIFGWLKNLAIRTVMMLHLDRFVRLLFGQFSERVQRHYYRLRFRAIRRFVKRRRITYNGVRRIKADDWARWRLWFSLLRQRLPTIRNGKVPDTSQQG